MRSCSNIAVIVKRERKWKRSQTNIQKTHPKSQDQKRRSQNRMRLRIACLHQYAWIACSWRAALVCADRVILICLNSFRSISFECSSVFRNAHRSSKKGNNRIDKNPSSSQQLTSSTNSDIKLLRRVVIYWEILIWDILRKLVTFF